eukprot:scaffold20998_cov118-Isochrysis_galbana.AAC.1
MLFAGKGKSKRKRGMVATAHHQHEHIAGVIFDLDLFIKAAAHRRPPCPCMPALSRVRRFAYRQLEGCSAGRAQAQPPGPKTSAASSIRLALCAQSRIPAGGPTAPSPPRPERSAVSSSGSRVYGYLSSSAQAPFTACSQLHFRPAPSWPA